MINWQLAYRFILHFFSAKRNGHGIHSPYAYELCEEVFYNPNGFYDFEELKTVREALLKNTTKLDTGSFGAGSKTFNAPQRRIKDIAARGISSFSQSEVLYKLIHFMGCKTSIELGTSLGLNTLYMARANTTGQVISLEGSKALCDVAMELAKKNKVTNVQFLNGDFDKTLPELLNTLDLFDLLYVDGNHTYEATLRYFEWALPKTHPYSVIVFDDIYWSNGMTRAWEEIKAHPSVTLSIDAFYFGLVFFRPEIKEKIHLKLFL